MGKINDLKDQALAVLRGKWGSFVGLTFVYFLLSCVASGILSAGQGMIGTSFTGLAAVFTIWGIIATLAIVPTQYGYMIAHLNSSRQDMPAEVGDLFCGYPRFWKILGTLLLYALAVTVGFFFLIIPGIILALAYGMVPFILHDNPELSATQTLTKSREMMKGHKWEYLLLILSFIGWILLGILTLCIGFLWIIPYMQMTEYKFYEQLREMEAEDSFIDMVKDAEMA